MLTLAHVLLTPAEVPFESFRFLLGPYEVLFGSLRRTAHALLMLCSCFAHAAFDEENKSKPCHTFLVRAVCTEGTQFSACRLLETEFQIWNTCVGTNHAPLTTLCWSEVATPLPQPEICIYIYIYLFIYICINICVSNVPCEPKEPRSTSIISWYYDTFLLSPKDPKSTSMNGIAQRSF